MCARATIVENEKLLFEDAYSLTVYNTHSNV